MTELTFVAPSTFRACWTSTRGTPAERAGLFARLARINTLSMIMQAGSGHIGTSFSSLDIVSWLYLVELNVYDIGSDESLPGIYFSSKGHDAPGLYSVLTATGRLDAGLVHRLRRDGGLPGHPDIRTPGIEANTGSLGMGISKAKGMIEANRLDGRTTPVFVLTGDGELQEGQNWEALSGAVNRGLGELTVIVDHNKIQSDTWVSRVSDLGDLEAKFAAFGWQVMRCDGHDLDAVGAAIAKLREDGARPGVLIADTIKGRGVSFMEAFGQAEDFYGYHSGAPSPDVYAAALAELVSGAREQAAAIGVDIAGLETVVVPARAPVLGAKLVDAWSDALVARAGVDERLVALDGDLVLDTGLVAFSRTFPGRFIECGIAEQDMVSQAGGLALRGRVPIVHSFASFLSGRPHEQVIVNSTEQRKILYVGSLAGIIPGGPGHSHQAVTDVASFSAVHGLLSVEPAHPTEVPALLDLLLDEHPGSAYVRLTTPPVELPFDWTQVEPLRIGVGHRVRAGRDITIVVAGPVLLREAWLASALLADDGIDVGIVAMPWLNTVDHEWWREETAAAPVLVTLENHVAHGGMGQYLLSQTSLLGSAARCVQIAVDGIPICGSTDEVLRGHRLDASSLAERLRPFVKESVS